MMRFMQNLIYFALMLSMLLYTLSEARPQNAASESSPLDVDNIESDVEEMRNAYYDMPAQPLYQGVPMDRLQMLFAQYRPNAYLRSPAAWNSMNELFRVPETKRQVRYRQCYFNPISCFKK